MKKFHPIVYLVFTVFIIVLVVPSILVVSFSSNKYQNGVV